jgi:hypothetical protein
MHDRDSVADIEGPTLSTAVALRGYLGCPKCHKIALKTNKVQYPLRDCLLDAHRRFPSPASITLSHHEPGITPLTMSFSRIVRFVPKSNPHLVLVGEPEDAHLDVGLATRSGQPVKVRVFSGTSVLQPGYVTHRVDEIERLLSPVSQHEIGTIRCIGLNVRIPHRERTGH